MDALKFKELCGLPWFKACFVYDEQSCDEYKQETAYLHDADFAPLKTYSSFEADVFSAHVNVIILSGFRPWKYGID